MVNKIFKAKKYKHIDKVLDVRDIMEKVKNKDFILQHGFYPFLSYTIDFKKFSKEIDVITQHHWKIKSRPIKYASHIDRCIYQWYSYNLNNAYNIYCDKYSLNDSAIAYRTCLKGQTNIEFAAKAFKFIKKCDSCYILISDFSSFFDTIDHKILKDNICEVLEKEKMDDDFYKVFRSMTKYSYIERNDIEDYLIKKGVETKESIKTNNSLFDNLLWKNAKRDLKECIKINKENFGIPQGSPLSGVFANVYMIKFDRDVYNYTKSKNGLYMRYSDDLIIVIPKNKVCSINDIWQELSEIKKSYTTLVMNIDKTSGYLYEEKRILSLHEEMKGLHRSPNFISYLGFSFDGQFVRFRDKTLTKFFYRYYRKIDSMVMREHERILIGRKRNTKIDKHRILKELNSNNGESRKFIDYVNRSKKVFYNEKYIVGFRRSIKKKVFERFELEKKKYTNLV